MKMKAGKLKKPLASCAAPGIPCLSDCTFVHVDNEKGIVSGQSGDTLRSGAEER